MSCMHWGWTSIKRLMCSRTRMLRLRLFQSVCSVRPNEHRKSSLRKERSLNWKVTSNRTCRSSSKSWSTWRHCWSTCMIKYRQRRIRLWLSRQIDRSEPLRSSILKWKTLWKCSRSEVVKVLCLVPCREMRQLRHSSWCQQVSVRMEVQLAKPNKDSRWSQTTLKTQKRLPWSIPKIKGWVSSHVRVSMLVSKSQEITPGVQK